MAHRAAAALRRRLRVARRRKLLAERRYMGRAMPVARPSPMVVNAGAGAVAAAVPEDQAVTRPVSKAAQAERQASVVLGSCARLLASPPIMAAVVAVDLGITHIHSRRIRLPEGSVAADADRARRLPMKGVDGQERMANLAPAVAAVVAAASLVGVPEREAMEVLEL